MRVLLPKTPVCVGALGLFLLVLVACETGTATLTTTTRPVLDHHDNDNGPSLPPSAASPLQRDAGLSNSTARTPAGGYDRDTYQWKHQCPQTRDLIPATNNRLEQMMWRLRSDAYRQDSAIRMSRAIQVDTTVTDALRLVDSHHRPWDFMDAFAHLLRKQFPQAHHHLHVDKIAKHGLVYTWRGSNSNLKPTVLLAHQDVVAVNEEDLGAWKYPPFDGHWDGKYVWGRGATDCKNTLIASLEAVEELLKAGFKPKRTVILANGFDEEIDGRQGAGNIVNFLLKKYGYGGIAAVVDEGSGITRAWSGKGMAAYPGVAEKGYFDVEITVQMPTGHSSMPPRDNSITVLSDLIHALHASQYEPSVGEENPVVQATYCAAHYDRGMSDFAWEMVRRADNGEITFRSIVESIIAMQPKMAGLFGTTQSIGRIDGGLKVNSVPGVASVAINHRIIFGESTRVVKQHVEEVIRAYANTHKPNGEVIAVIPWEGPVTPNFPTTFSQTITLSAMETTFVEPSVVSPFLINRVTPYSVLQGTIYAQYGSNIMYVAPSLMPANTDSRYYTPLTKHIFKFNPTKDVDDDSDDISGLHGPHTTNERINMVGHINAVQWYSLYLRNMDEATMADEIPFPGPAPPPPA